MQHSLLVRDLKSKQAISVAAAVALVGLATGNLAFGFGAGIRLYLLLGLVPTVRGLFSPVH